MSERRFPMNNSPYFTSSVSYGVQGYSHAVRELRQPLIYFMPEVLHYEENTTRYDSQFVPPMEAGSNFMPEVLHYDNNMTRMIPQSYLPVPPTAAASNFMPEVRHYDYNMTRMMSQSYLPVPPTEAALNFMPEVRHYDYNMTRMMSQFYLPVPPTEAALNFMPEVRHYDYNMTRMMSQFYLPVPPTAAASNLMPGSLHFNNYMTHVISQSISAMEAASNIMPGVLHYYYNMTRVISQCISPTEAASPILAGLLRHHNRSSNYSSQAIQDSFPLTRMPPDIPTYDADVVNVLENEEAQQLDNSPLLRVDSPCLDSETLLNIPEINVIYPWEQTASNTASYLSTASTIMSSSINEDDDLSAVNTGENVLLSQPQEVKAQEENVNIIDQLQPESALESLSSNVPLYTSFDITSSLPSMPLVNDENLSVMPPATYGNGTLMPPVDTTVDVNADDMFTNLRDLRGVHSAHQINNENHFQNTFPPLEFELDGQN